MDRDRFTAMHEEMEKDCSDAQLQESITFFQQAAMARRMTKGGGKVAKPTPARTEPPPGQASTPPGQVNPPFMTTADRKMSMAGSANQDQEKHNLARLLTGSVLKALGWEGWDRENVMELAGHFDSFIANSGVNVDDTVSKWYEASFPTQGMAEKAKEGKRQF
ncbi:hypothetical protein TrVE_jg11958, partial [Triparma verrucosa]